MPAADSYPGRRRETRLNGPAATAPDARSTCGRPVSIPAWTRSWTRWTASWSGWSRSRRDPGDRRAAAGRPAAGPVRPGGGAAEPAHVLHRAARAPARPRSRCGWPSCCKRLGYSRRGHLVAVTREELVGQYVGHTAPKTKEVLKRAMGGVLFIDEAYYLYRAENERDYGQEAIEILLQVMENQREDLVVILAGYKDRMDTFFQSNPGMSSRIAHHIDFPDYSLGELLAIGDLMVAEAGYRLSPEADGDLPRLPCAPQRAATVRERPQRPQRAGAGPPPPRRPRPVRRADRRHQRRPDAPRTRRLPPQPGLHRPAG